jgi:phosphate transport system permease protein
LCRRAAAVRLSISGRPAIGPARQRLALSQSGGKPGREQASRPGVSRALGETAPLITIGALTFIAFLPTPPISTEPPFISFQWLWYGFTVLPIQAFNWISRPGHDFHANAAAACLVLLLLTLGLNAVAIYLRYRLRKKLQ